MDILIKAMLVVALLTTLAGCFPYAKSYVHLEASGGKPAREICQQHGPYVALDFDNSGVQFRVSLEPGNSQRSKTAFVRLRVERDAVIAVPNPVALILDRDGKETAAVKLALTHGSQERAARLISSARDAAVAEYLFEFVDLPPLSSPGSLKLPVVYAGDVAVSLPLIRFDRRAYVGVLPLNC